MICLVRPTQHVAPFCHGQAQRGPLASVDPPRPVSVGTMVARRRREQTEPWRRKWCKHDVTGLPS
eukprot:522425-Pyramimonas_sp.AAC.1